MIQKDFILRQIQQLVQVLARVMRLRAEGQVVEARQEVHEGLVSLFGIGTRELLELDEHQLLELCRHNGALHPEIAVVLAELLEEEGILSNEEGGDSGAVLCWRRALFLYNTMLSQGATVPIDVHDRIDRLQNWIEDTDPSGPSGFLPWDGSARSGR